MAHPAAALLSLQTNQKLVEYNSDVGHDTGGARVGTTQGSVRWGIERRLEFIEFRLFWEGHVNRGDLMAAFGISINQASTDLNRYLGMAPNNMVYDKSARTYVRGDRFEPLFLKPDPASYLSQLRSISDGIVTQEETWVGQLPDFDTVPSPVRGIDAHTLRRVIEAIRTGQALEVEYQSLSNPAPRWRWIAPHAIAFDGFRWHARAYCFTDGCFKDFLLARILGTRDSRPSDIDDSQDADWHTHVTLKIGPHPGLSDAQKKVVALDYGMRDGKASITVRKALLYYTLKRLGLDTDPAARKPSDQQIALLNQEGISISGHSPPSPS
ncbi:WYL domain-containing protein [Thermomonas hydrothermalis]|uniref:WYL domain-containing protein n=1 Tax=Thermomonas hydrothermalis TaxID=213588 RepID=A0A1M4ZTQ5_9GAMM|nr:WYL domain-containing protein [Thermomonas hydrothermalis]SHF21325.1 WYL domain-containing protein [Thermomonas hydrothermalis]